MFHLSRKFTVPVAALFLSASLVSLSAQTATTTPAVTITVASSANPSVFAAPVTFTIVVAAPTAAGPVPTGTVSATLLGPVFLGGATLDGSGKAVITVPPQPSLLATPSWGLAAGSDSITFSYSGDTKYKAAQSVYTQFVNKANTTTTAAVNGSSQPLRISATVQIAEPSASTTPFVVPGNLSNSAPTGTVQFFDGTTSLGTATLSITGLFTSTATLNVVTVPASLTAVYAGDNNFNGSTSPPVVGTGKGTVNLTVTSNANPSTFAEPVTFTVTAAPAASGGPVPTGTVSASLLGLFNLGSVTLDVTGKGSLTVPSNVASSVAWGLAAGSNDITFNYAGDAHYSATHTDFTQTVNKAATVTAATVAPSSLSITATVSISEPSVSPISFALPGPNGAVPNPQGSVQFMNGNAVIGTAPLSPSGLFQASATLTVLQPFSSTADLTAVYNGDANYTGSTSSPATMPTLAAVTVGVQSSVNPSTFAEPVILTIKVTPFTASSTLPSGTVQASVLGSDVLGIATLDSTGNASITVPSQLLTPSTGAWGLATGSNSITVTYSGDNTFAAGQTTFTETVNQANTSTTLLPAPVANPVNGATYVATVSIDEPSVSRTDFRIPAAGNLSTSPTGNVDFYDGATLIKSVALSPSSLFQSNAVLNAASVTATVRAVYNGDTNYNGSSSAGTGPGNGSVTIALASSANPAAYGAALTIMATVAPSTAGPTPTGTVQFFDGTQNLGWTATLDSSGHATVPIPLPLATPLVCVTTCPPPASVLVLGAGSHTITAQYSGDANYAAATSTTSVIQQIGKVASTTSVAALAATIGPIAQTGVIASVADAQPPSGGPYHFEAMTGTGLVDGDPTGTVTFYSAGSSIGTGTLAPSYSGNVTSTAGLNTTSAALTGFYATYPGDANFQASSSPVPAATGVTLTASPNPSNTGQSVTLTATISSAATTPALTGRVQFFDGVTLLGAATVSGATATITTTFTSAGSHSLTAAYSGDANYQGATSAAYAQVVNTSTTPTDTLKLTISTNTAVFGQHVVLFAQVAGTVSTPPTGTVNFLDGTAVIGPGTLSQSSAYLVVALAVGTHSISASWAGDSNWPAAQSAAVSLTVNRAASVTSLANFGDVWTAVVMAMPPGEGTPTGSVQFIDAVTQAVLATVNLSNGTATAALGPVSHPVQAVYSGDTNFTPSTSRDSSTRPPRSGR